MLRSHFSKHKFIKVIFLNNNFLKYPKLFIPLLNHCPYPEIKDFNVSPMGMGLVQKPTAALHLVLWKTAWVPPHHANHESIRW